MTRRLAGSFALVLALAACSGGDGESDPPAESPSTAAPQPSATTPTPVSAEDALETAVRSYSTAFLTGEGVTAFSLLSSRCKDAQTLGELAALTKQAEKTYGELPITSLEVSVDGDLGTATYTYDVAELDQEDEPWVDEDGWKNDDC